MDYTLDGGSRIDPDELARLSLMSCLRRGFECAPSKRVIVTQNKTLSYAQAFNEAGVLAWYLRSAFGVEPGQTVVLSCPNLARAPIVLAATEMCGARLALLPAKLTQADYVNFVALVRPTVAVLSDPDHCAMACEVAPHVRVLSLGCRVTGMPCIDDVVRNAVYGPMMEVPDMSDRAEFVVFSSGTTGLPKAIVNKSLSFAYNGIQLRRALAVTCDDVAFVPVPLAHVFGVVGMYAMLGGMGTVVSLEKYTPDDACQIIQSSRATLHLGVPTMFLRELRVNHDDSWDFTTLRSGIVAGSSCPESVFVEFEERYGCRLMPSYGMSETSATLTVADISLPVLQRARTDGYPILGAQIRILEGTGEVLCKSPSMMSGIIRPDGTFDVGVDEEGWLHTGDIAVPDGRGGIRISGRIKDMVIRGGINIFPAEVERVYAGHPDVSECCLVGYPDPELGERTAMCVVLRPECDDASSDLRNYAKGRIEKVKIPDIVLKMDDFPRLASGKINKKQLHQDVLDTLKRIGAIA